MEGVPGSLLPEAVSLLAQYETTVRATLAAARARGECRFPVTFELGLATPSPQIDDLKNLTRIMSLRARVAIARGNYDEAIESIEANVAASRAFDHQVSLVEHQMRLVVIWQALWDIENLLSEADLTDKQFVRLQTLLAGVQLEEGLRNALLGERGLGYQSFHTFPLVPAIRPTVTTSEPMADGRLTSPGPCLVYLQVMQEYIDASRMPLPKGLAESDQVRSWLKAKSETFDYQVLLNISGIRSVFPAAESVFLPTAQSQAQRGLLLLAFAAKRHRLAHGSDVATLDELMPEFLPAIPVDPFDGQPLRIKVANGELVFYSVSFDRIDNGGQDPDDRGVPDLTVRHQVGRR